MLPSQLDAASDQDQLEMLAHDLALSQMQAVERREREQVVEAMQRKYDGMK